MNTPIGGSANKKSKPQFPMNNGAASAKMPTVTATQPHTIRR